LADCWIVGSLGDIGLIVRINGLVGRIVQNGLNSFIDLDVSFINLDVSFISLGLVGFIGLGLISIAGLIGHISLVGLGGFSGISGLVSRISLVSLIGLIGLVGLISLGKLGITSLVGSSASSACRLTSLVGSLASARQLISLIGFVIAAKVISRRLKQAAALGVATLQSRATEIVDVAFYYFASSSLHVCLLVREKMCWWLALARKKIWQWIASFGESYHGDVLQFAKQLLPVRLLLMTKFFVMRECDKYLCAVTTVFSQQDGIYGFKFPKRFLEISSRDLTLFSTLLSILI
jgi:hypothetical protein